MKRLLLVLLALSLIVVLAPRPAVGDDAPAPGALLRTLTGHISWVLSVAVTPDGSKIVSGSGDKALKVWELNTGQCLRTLTRHEGAVMSVAVTPDGSKVVSGSYDKTLKVWDLNTGALLRTLTGHALAVGSVAVTSDGSKIVSGAWDNTIKVWDLNTGQCLRTFNVKSSVGSLAVTPDGTKIVFLYWQKEHWRAIDGIHSGELKVPFVKILDLNGGKQIHNWNMFDVFSGTITLKEFQTEEGALALTPDGRRFAFVRDAEHAVVLDLNTLQGKTFTGGAFEGDATSVVVTPDGTHIVSGFHCLRATYSAKPGPDGGIHIPSGFHWESVLEVLDMNSLDCQVLTGHTDQINSVAVSPDGTKIVSGSNDATIKVWNMPSAPSPGTP